VWKALVGIDLDQRPGRYLIEVEAETGPTVLRESRAIVVAPRKFPTRTLRVNPAFVNPSPAELARIRGDQTFLSGVYAASANARLWSSAFVRPVPGEANSSFGTRSVFNGEPRSPHGGTDFLSPTGTPIKSPNAGRIVCARDLYFTGNTVIIDHGLAMFSMLAHLSRIDVKEGDSVQASQIVGLVGATGRVTGPHLHWALSIKGARVDPLSLLALLGN
jgi:murein DD-endopeptidase MepM/ murein hydrolase activator NlpD